jgi:5'-methylthioadenosine phosphorylase
MQAEIGIIGGTGIYDSQLIQNKREVKVHTPYGSPSDLIIIGDLESKKVAFIPRHSRNHIIKPTDVNSRANIYALKKLGVQRILAPAAVGSLKEEYKPGDIVIVDQFIDRTTKREQSFYSGPQICHISVADPMCPELRAVLIKISEELKIKYHKTGTYICIEGPRFSTKAESKMFKNWGADIIGMTLVPECVLAREAEICYTSIATITDYDVWKDNPVNVDEIIIRMKKNVQIIKKLVKEAVLRIPKKRACNCKNALENAII